jgi:hypothetical protein
MSDKIVEAITEQWGERCPDFDADCACCQVWAEYDARAGNRDGTRTETMTEVNDEMVLAFCRAYLPAPPDMMSAKEAASIRNHVRAALSAALAVAPNASRPAPTVEPVAWRYPTRSAPPYEYWSYHHRPMNKQWDEAEPLYSASTISALEAERDEARAKATLYRSMMDDMVPISKDGTFVFIDGAGDVELDHGGKMRVTLATANARIAGLEKALGQVADIHQRNFGRQYEKLADIGPIARAALTGGEDAAP